MKKLSAEEITTNNTYDKQASNWSSKHTSKGFWAKEMKDFADELPNGKLLEIGAGGGRDAKELISAGYDYRGTDISGSLLKIAKANNPNAIFDKVSVYDLNYSTKFDGFWCSAVLLHIPRENIDAALIAIKQSMKTGAIGFISIKEGAGEMMMQDKKSTSNDERYFVFWSDKEFSMVLKNNGYKIIKKGYNPMSKKTKWLTYIVETT